MTKVNINSEPDYGIPVVVPGPDGTETLYAEARVNDRHIVLTPKGDFNTKALKGMVEAGLILGITAALPEYQHAMHPFLDGNGLDEDRLIDYALADVANTEKLFEGDEPEIGMAEEPLDAKIYRLEGDRMKVKLIEMVLSHRNPGTLEEKLRQIQVIVE